MMTPFHRSPALRAGIVAAVMIGLAVPRAAAQSTGPATPSAPHERLGFFEGTWTIREFPAEQRYRETCAWLAAGRRHMVCRSRWSAPGGPREGMSMFSFRAADSTYLYYGLRAGGGVEALEGHPQGGGWVFESDSGTGSARRRVRVTIAPPVDGSMRFIEETSAGDGPWKRDEVNYVQAPPGD